MSSEWILDVSPEGALLTDRVSPLETERRGGNETEHVKGIGSKTREEMIEDRETTDL